MSLAMSSRGPDDHGALIDPGIGLVHRRLSILDLSEAGRCPISNEDGSIHAVHNGEIYNFAALREQLIDAGHHFRSNCASEVIVHGYECLLFTSDAAAHMPFSGSGGPRFL